VKADLWVDGRISQDGYADLRIEPCDGDGSWNLPLTFHGGRWNAAIDTSGMEYSCYDVHAWTRGLDAGSFRMLLRGDAPATNLRRPHNEHRDGGPDQVKPKSKPEPEHRPWHRPRPTLRHAPH
jgi:hypothetical protein